MKLPKQVSPAAGVALGLATFFALSLALQTVGPQLKLTASTQHVLLKTAILVLAFIVAGCHPTRLPLLGMRFPKGWLWIPLTIVSGLTGIAGTLLLLAFKGRGLPLLRELGFVEIVLTVWLLSSVAEEFYCRGLFQSWIDDNAESYWTNKAVWASAVLFGGMHLSLILAGADSATVAVIVPMTTLLGYWCAVARRLSQSLWPPILAHVGFNVGGVVGAVIAIVVLGWEAPST